MIQNLTPIDYRCKICRKAGVVYYDTACPIKMLESWTNALCCDRCYKFRDSYITAKRTIEKSCIALINTRHSVKDQNTRKETESKIREKLSSLTQRIARLCSDYYQVQNIWDSEMVSILIDNPAGCNKAMDSFHSSIRKISFTPKQQEMIAA